MINKNNHPKGKKYEYHICIFILLICASNELFSDTPLESQKSELSTFFIPVKRIVWTSQQYVKNEQALIGPGTGQANLEQPSTPCILEANPDSQTGGSILLDFGQQIAGNVELFTARTKNKNPVKIRIRLGESVSEAMAELGGASNAQNDHVLRDDTIKLPWLGKRIFGPGGFRFVRIDNVDSDLPVHLSEVRAALTLRDIPTIGSFKCDDDRLNQIWEVGAYTVHLNMQELLYDGVKRDRLVWIGDLHPEVSTINAAFGYNKVVPLSLDYIRDLTPANEWMNGICSYSMWWILIHEQWWMHHGDRKYLEEQKDYLVKLATRLRNLVGPNGKETIEGRRFLDWPSSSNEIGVTAGLQGLLTMSLGSCSRLLKELGAKADSNLCALAEAKAKAFVPPLNNSKSGAALIVLAGMRDPVLTANDTLTVNGPTGLSTFYGFYVLKALSKANQTETALDFISQYWGGMLDLGATTFWEHFELSWAENAAAIDNIVPSGKNDIHAEFGEHCYIGFRHSLCHGWASGPTAWLSETVLGITPTEPGFRKVKISPQLGNLKWAKGTYPTPYGPIFVRHERKADGTIKTTIDCPNEITIQRN